MYMLPLAKLFIKEIVHLQGAPVSIVSNGDSIYVSRFWATLNKAMGTLHFNNMFHLQTDDQTEWTNQTLEDMLRTCVLDFKTEWDVDLPLCEFTYNNSFHTSIRTAPYEALYGRRYRTPV
eukprot:TRINITY_DN40883_c0_g1_i1.p1 TRINITY_DN40883_c0_g1~~TRINITY_DN40883_c0_g1_i1.p1  ORF type:complete len:120 (+),score=0.05 TRINITY_DN40883_c0_g1_i1:904-1263(+)